MKTGFLTLETHPDHGGLVRVRIRDEVPELSEQEDGTEIRYVARFKDIEAGRMHVQNMMHRSLVDLENRIYRKDLDEMIACVEADNLDHTRVWMDPAVNQQSSSRIEQLVEKHKLDQKWLDLIWRAVGVAGLVLLLITAMRL
ncbi:MAG: hypothetical protein KZQ80_17460 [Candidatus Thiodiazotropha sp. (ex Monitilora ramsayi)]|nr:hypothetical protein [Candidatus Thiodiazotropha sp. (ex Monitilora ramsayi)]